MSTEHTWLKSGGHVFAGEFRSPASERDTGRRLGASEPAIRVFELTLIRGFVKFGQTRGNQRLKLETMGETATSADGARHWNSTYESRGAAGVSWFQSEPTVSLEVIGALEVSHDAAIIDIGGGASVLVDHLLLRGFTDVSVLDISSVGLADARQRVGEGASVSWLCQDVLSWSPQRRYDLWHDRAVFHFLTDDVDRKAYLDVLHSSISSDGALIMATFAEDGPEYCSGLPVARYSADGLSEVIGGGWEVVEVRREVHTTPAGAAQPFTWIAARPKR